MTNGPNEEKTELSMDDLAKLMEDQAEKIHPLMSRRPPKMARDTWLAAIIVTHTFSVHRVELSAILDMQKQILVLQSNIISLQEVLAKIAGLDEDEDVVAEESETPQ